MLTLPLYINKSGALLRRLGYSDKYSNSSGKLAFKRGITYRLEVFFVGDDNSTKARLANPAEVVVVMKPKSKFDSTVSLATASATAHPATDADPYILTLLVHSAELDTEMLVDNDENNDKDFVDVEFEVAWTEDDWATRNATTDLILATITNNVHRGDEGAPTPSPTSEEWLAGQTEAIIEALGLTTYGDLAAANAVLAAGDPYYDTALGRLNIATS